MQLMCYYPLFIAGASVGLFIGVGYMYIYYTGVEKNTNSWFHLFLSDILDKQYVEDLKILIPGATISFLCQVTHTRTHKRIYTNIDTRARVHAHTHTHTHTHTQWIGSFIWPPFNYERHSHRLEYQELEESTNFR